jgi:rhamnogalacturonan endolyase
VRTGTYGLQAWANGGDIADVATTYLKNDIHVTADEPLDLDALTWIIPDRERIFRVGDLDRRSDGFAYGGLPHEHARIAKCPADLTFTVGESQTSDWCFGQSYIGSWDIAFTVDSAAAAAGNRSATLSVSLAGYSTGASLDILLNNATKIGNLTSGAVGTNVTDSLANDPSAYRSGTPGGEWRFFDFDFDGSALSRQAVNTISFVVTRNTTWRGFIYDGIVLDW